MTESRNRPPSAPINMASSKMEAMQLYKAPILYAKNGVNPKPLPRNKVLVPHFGGSNAGVIISVTPLLLVSQKRETNPTNPQIAELPKDWHQAPLIRNLLTSPL